MRLELSFSPDVPCSFQRIRIHETQLIGLDMLALKLQLHSAKMKKAILVASFSRLNYIVSFIKCSVMLYETCNVFVELSNKAHSSKKPSNFHL